MRWRVAAILVMAIGLALAVTMFIVVERGRWITAATELRWVDRDGKALDGDTTCISLTGFESGVVLGDRWIVPCYHDSDHEGLFAFEPRRGEVRLLWPAAGNLVAMAVGDRDTLGVVFASHDGFVIAIAGRDGWIHAPERFASTTARVLGIAWNDGGVEVMFAEAREPDVSALFTMPQLARATPGKPATTRPIARPGTACPSDCVNWLGFRHPQRGWVELVGVQDHPTYAGEDGQVVDAPVGLIEHGGLNEAVDFSAVGLAPTMWEVPERALMPDGTLIPYPAGPFADMVPSRPRSVMHVREGRLIAVPWWGYRAPGAVARVGRHKMVASPDVFAGLWAQQVNRANIVVAVAHSVISIGTDPAQLHGVARVFGGAFAIGGQALIPDGDGFFLVGNEGDSVSLDAALQRRDPTSLRDHLITGGSEYKFEDATGNFPQLVFVLVGWAPAMLLGWLLSRRLGARGFVVTGALYLALAGLWTLHLAPLLM
jgi:hypothetical protein